MDTDQYQKKLAEAKKKVADIKSFHTHLRAYILVNLLILLVRSGFVNRVFEGSEHVDPQFLDWLDWNIILTPLLWGIGLAIHGLYVYQYKFKFLRKWEERQIRKYMEEEETDLNRYN